MLADFKKYLLPVSFIAAMLAVTAASFISLSAIKYAPTNAILAQYPAYAGDVIVRQGFTALGDAPPATYQVSASACPTPDNGDQVTMSGGCAKMIPTGDGVDIREWGVFPNAGTTVDAAAGERAACVFSQASGLDILFPVGLYYQLTSDSGTHGAVYMGGTQSGTISNTTSPCNFRGYTSPDYPDLSAAKCPELVAGANFNLPIVYVDGNVSQPSWQNICLNGNASQQTPSGGQLPLSIFKIASWTGGSPEGYPETSAAFYRVAFIDGYNSGLFIGSFRGVTVLHDDWCVYGGQSGSDGCIVYDGYDLYADNLVIGGTMGYGYIIGEGSQYQIQGGASFLNEHGSYTAGGAVTYSVVSNFNYQENMCNGVVDDSTAPFLGQTPAGHDYIGDTFDGNSESGTGSCADVLIENNNTLAHFVAPQFTGGSNSSLYLPSYSFQIGTNSKVYVSSPALAATPVFVFGNTHTNTVLDTLTINGVANASAGPAGWKGGIDSPSGWSVGMAITDSAGAIPSGDTIKFVQCVCQIVSISGTASPYTVTATGIPGGLPTGTVVVLGGSTLVPSTLAGNLTLTSPSTDNANGTGSMTGTTSGTGTYVSGGTVTTDGTKVILTSATTATVASDVFTVVPATVAYANDFTKMRGDFPVTPRWTPTFTSANHDGSVTYCLGVPNQVGSWSLKDQMLTVTGLVCASTYSGFTGQFEVGGLPFQSNAMTSNYGTCSFDSIAGWTGPSGYTLIGAGVGNLSTLIQFNRSGSGGVSPAPSAATEWAPIGGVLQFLFTCTYPILQ